MSRVAQNRTAGASKKKSLVVPSMPKIRSIRAEPLSEDDFDAETRDEAAHYAAVQANELAREQQREENRRLKEQGLPVKALPRKIQERRPQNAVDDEESEEDDDGGDGYDERYYTSTGKKMKKKPKNRYSQREHELHNQGREDTLRYEGQVILPFDPLYALAGLKEETSYPEMVEREKARLLDAYFASHDRPSDTAPLEPKRTSKMTMRNGCLVKKGTVDERPMPQSTYLHIKKEPEDVKPDPASVKVQPVKAVQGDDVDQEEMPEIDYDDDTAVSAAIAQSRTSPTMTAAMAGSEDVKPSTAQLSIEGEEYEEEEGSYSDDEAPIFMRSQMPSSQITQSQSQTQSMSFAALGPDLPDVKPHFPFNDSQAQLGSHHLDGAAGPAIPAPINKFLKPYQRTGVQFMYDLYKQGRGGILGDDMGLGKTVQVIAFLSAIMRKMGTKMDFNRRKDLIRRGSEGQIAPRHWPTALILCPSSLVSNRELETWGFFESQVWDKANSSDLELGFRKGYYDVLLTSYEQAISTIDRLKEMPFSTVIVDEAHRLKEPRASRTLAMKKIQCSACFALTGTLIQNRIEEMWSVLDFRGWAGTFRQWREFAVLPIKKGHRLDGTAHDVVMGIMRLGQVYSKILPHFYIRRDKRLIAHELPEKRDLIVFCPLAEKQIQAYQNLIDSDDIQFIIRRNEKCECGSGLTRMHCCHTVTAAGESVRDVVLKNINALSKVANHFGLLYHARDDPPHMRDVNSKIFEICTGRPYQHRQDNAAQAAMDPTNCGKWTLLQELLKQWRSEREKKHKVLIFSNSVRLLKMIQQFIVVQFSGFEFDIFTGDVNQKDRMRMVDNFQDPTKDHFIMLISTQAGGVGLNLTAANKVVIFDPDWNPANDLQAMDRAFRIGQQRTVEVYRMIGLGTLEELKYERQIHKQQRSRQLNDGAFERRIHQGMEGGKSAAEQGELFGTQNIFRFNPNGFVAGNLERVRAAEDRFAQDLIEAEYDDEDEDEEGLGEDEVEAKRIKRERKDMQIRQARRERLEEKARIEIGRKVDDVLGDDGNGGRGKDDEFKDVLDRIGGVKSHVHETAFQDSPAERQIYEIGIKLLRDNPELAKTMKANDLGKLGGVKRTRRSSASKGDVSTVNADGIGGHGYTVKRESKVDDDDEPWLKRLSKKPKAAKLITLSDDED